jgi:lipopolysaccharide transport system permease protein
VLGVAWAILQPIIAMLIFTVIFGRFARFPTDGVPYPLFVLAGLIPWSFFSTSIALAGQSLINQQHLLTKVYFPRLFIPAAGVGAHLVDMAISLGLYAVMMVFFRTPPGIGVLTLPLLIMLTIIATSGIGILLAALTVEYRDFKYVVPFMVQTLLFMSPVVYPSRMVSPTAQVILAFNPMAGIVEGFRSALLGRPWNVTTLAISTVMSFVFFFVGVVYFRRTERYFADIA